MGGVYMGNVTVALPLWTTYLAVIISGLAGATYAARRGFDVIGVLALSVTTGLGGLILRDILLARGPVVLENNTFLVCAGFAALVGFFFAGLLARYTKVLLMLEALSMGLLATVGVDSAVRAGMPGLAAILVGTLVATAGSLMRDVLGGDAPQLVRPGVLNGFVALGGSIAFLLILEWTKQPLLAQVLVIVLVFVVRGLSIRRGWRTKPAEDVSDRVWAYWNRAVHHDD